jgi:hypothetical protein
MTTAAHVMCMLPLVMGQCADVNEFIAMSASLTAACCAGDGACSGGIPNACSDNCAEILLPLRATCAEFLKGDGAVFKQTIDDAADKCPAVPCVPNREQQIGGSGGSLEPPGCLLEPPGPLLEPSGPLFTHLHTVYTG